jgi:pyrroloquinoline-quinone synthase
VSNSSTRSGAAYGEGVGTGFLAGLTTRDLRPRQEALLNHPLWAGVQTQATTREQLARFALQDAFLIREIYRLDSLAIAKAPTTKAADALIAKLTPKSGALDTLVRFGEAVGLTRQDFDRAQPLAPCLALTAQFYYHLARSSFAETVACIGASETIFLEICGRIDAPLRGYGCADEALTFFSFHEALEPAERATTEMLRPLVTTEAKREAVTRAAELCYGFEKMFYDAVLSG